MSRLNIPTPDATTTATGKVELAGDLANTAISPQVISTHLSAALPVNQGGTAATSASITAFNNITGFSAAGTTGTTSTNLVFSTSPSFTTPTLGVASATSINKMAITAPATSSTLAIADGKTHTVNNSITLAGTDSTTMTFPSSSDTVVTLGATQSLTNKTLTSGTNLLITSNAASNEVSTNESTTSTSYTDLTTTGPSVTVTIGNSGSALVTISTNAQNSLAGDYAEISYALSGSNTVAAGAPYEVYFQAPAINGDTRLAASFVMTGLSAGSTTFKMKYRAILGGTASFQNRLIGVIPL